MVDTRRDPVSEDRRPALTVPHRCTECGDEFLYRYTSRYRDEVLQPIDFVCRACLPRWYDRWASLHGWKSPAGTPCL